MENIIEIKNLSKSFGEVRAVSELSFSVKRGEFFAFLGENGAGKSTTISIITGEYSKDAGEVFVSGSPVEKSGEDIARRLGVVYQTSGLDAVLTVKETLTSRAALYGIFGEEFEDRLAALSKRLDFEGLINRQVGKLSGGEKRRIDIARALIHKPEILILDEPTTGLDPQSRRTLWEVIHTLQREEGLTVFLTTHYMEEVTDADYVVILDSGKLSAEGTPLELKNRFTSDSITVYGVSEEEIKTLAKPYVAVAGGYRVNLSGTKEATELILKNPEIFVDYEITKGKMDDVFLAVTGKSLHGGEVK